MLESLKRWIAGGASEKQTDPELEEFGAWAAARQYVIRVPREADGLIIEGHTGPHPWRLEWGPSQRPYVTGQELRIRAEPGIALDAQAMILNRQLQETMEAAVYDQFVESVQTRIDTETPPEMRWLVMLSKLPAHELGPLRERFTALGGFPPWVQSWLVGPLTEALLRLDPDPAMPLVLMIGRGRLTLRTALAEAGPTQFEPFLRLFDAAMLEALRVSEQGVPEADAPDSESP